MKEKTLRSIELVIALVTSYLGSVTLVQTSLYGILIERISNIFRGPGKTAFILYVDVGVIALSLILSFYMWGKENEIWIGRLFSLNMLMFFPAVLDFSTFNWVAIIIDYTPNSGVTANWVFAVGLALQLTYLLLRYTVRFRYLRTELETRGAIQEEIDNVTSGQINYLAILSILTAIITASTYLLIPYLSRNLSIISNQLPFNHIVIGITVVLWIAAALIIYLRSISRETSGEIDFPLKIE